MLLSEQCAILMIVALILIWCCFLTICNMSFSSPWRQAGLVECERHRCGSMDGCHAVLFERPDHSCCDVCKGNTPLPHHPPYLSGVTFFIFFLLFTQVCFCCCWNVLIRLCDKNLALLLHHTGFSRLSLFTDLTQHVVATELGESTARFEDRLSMVRLSLFIAVTRQCWDIT